MNMNHRNMMGPGFYGCDDFPDDYGFSQPYYRYKNAYGDYRGGYDRGNQGPSPYGFGPIRPPQPPFPMFPPQELRRRDFGGDNMIHYQNRNKNFKHLLRCGLQRQQIIKLPGDLLNLMQPLNCGLCAQQFETYDLSKIHYLSKNHAKNIKKWMNQRSVSKGPKEPFRPRDQYCELCDVEITSTDHAASHYSGKPHRSIVEGRKNSRNPILLQPHMKTRLRILIRREKKIYKKISDTDGDNKKIKPDPSTVPPELYCNICQTVMTCSEQMTTHLNGKKHLNKEKQHILKLMKGEAPDGNNQTTEADAEDKEDEEDEDEDDEEELDGEGMAMGEEEGEGKGQGEGQDEKNKNAADDWGADGDEWKPSPEDY